MLLVKGKEEKTAESERVRDNYAVGERTLGKEEKVKAKSEKEEGDGFERKDVELNEKKKVQQENESIYAGSVYDGSMYGGSTYGGSVYGDGVWPRRRKSFFKICNAAPSFYPNLSR